MTQLQVGTSVQHPSERTMMSVVSLDGDFAFCQTVSKKKWKFPKRFKISELKVCDVRPIGMIL